MNRKKLFILLWPPMALIGAVAVLRVAAHSLSLDYFLRMYADGLFGKKAYPPYTVYALCMLAFSFVYWILRPGIKSLAATIIAAWGLCGFGAFYVPFLVSSILSGNAELLFLTGDAAAKGLEPFVPTQPWERLLLPAVCLALAFAKVFQLDMKRPER